MQWIDLTHQDIKQFLIDNDLRTKYALLGFSHIFDYQKYPEYFVNESEIVYGFRFFINYLVIDIGNSGLRCKRTNIGIKNTIKIQILKR